MANSLTDLAALKSHMGITTTDAARDTRLSTILDQVVSYMQRRIGRKLFETTYTEYYKGSGSDTLLLRQTPVQSITSVHVDPDGYWGQGPGTPYDTDDALTEGTDFALDLDDQLISGTAVSTSGALMRIGGVWSMESGIYSNNVSQGTRPGLGNIKVVYVAGYPSADIPPELVLCAHQLTATVFHESATGQSLKEKEFEGYRREFFSAIEAKARAATFEDILNQYAEVYF